MGKTEKAYRNNNSKVSDSTWNSEFDLPQPLINIQNLIEVNGIETGCNR